MFLALNFVKLYLFKSKHCPNSKVKVNMPNCSDKVKIWDLLKDTCLSQKLDGVMGKMNPVSAEQHWTLCVLSTHGFPPWWSPGNQVPMHTEGLVSATLKNSPTGEISNWFPIMISENLALLNKFSLSVYSTFNTHLFVLVVFFLAASIWMQLLFGEIPYLMRWEAEVATYYLLKTPDTHFLQPPFTWVLAHEFGAPRLTY
jgi:hypothetical protein